MKKHLKDYFIPHEGNEYKPHSLRKAAVFGMMLLVLLSFSLANFQSLIWISSEWMVSTILPAVIVDLTNEEREDNSLSTLRRNPTLDAAAKLKAEDMAKNSYFAHYSPTGISPWHWFNLVNYNFVHAGENLAIHFTDSDDVVDAWMNSPTHRANIVDADFTEIGVGTAAGTFEGYKTIYVVQLFGTQAAAPQVAEETPTPDPVVLAESSNVPENTETEPTETNPQIAGSDEVVTEVDDTEVSLSTDRDPIAVTSTDEIAVASDTASQTDIADVQVTDESFALYSDLISTSTGGIPASIAPDTIETTPGSTPAILRAATQPHTVLQIVYSIIGVFVLFALILSIAIEIRRQQPVQIVYSAGLMAAMAALFYVHVAITSGAIIV